MNSNMNSQEEFIFFALLRNAIWQQPLQPEVWTDKWEWTPIVNAIKEHALQTLMAGPVLSLPASYRPSAEVQNYFTQMLAANIQEHIRLNADLVMVFQLLQSNGFHPVLMKGQGNASFYANPLARKCGDIDVYVGEKDYDAARDFLLQHIQGACLGGETDKHVEVRFGRTEVEIHKYAEVMFWPQCNRPYQQLTQSYFENPDFVKINGVDIPVPPKQFIVLYVFDHMLHHFKLEGVGFRQIVDVVVLLHHFAGQIDEAQFKKDLESVNLVRDWQLFTPLFVRLLGLPSAEIPCYKDDSQCHALVLGRLILSDGNFASNCRKKKKSANPFISKCKSFGILMVRDRELAKISVFYALRYAVASVNHGLYNVVRRLRGEKI